jgi:hypothetical protein
MTDLEKKFKEGTFDGYGRVALVSKEDVHTYQGWVPKILEEDGEVAVVQENSGFEPKGFLYSGEYRYNGKTLDIAAPFQDEYGWCDGSLESQSPSAWN